jgi:hypothetical protein
MHSIRYGLGEVSEARVNTFLAMAIIISGIAASASLLAVAFAFLHGIH